MLFVIIQLAFRLMDLKEFFDDILVDVVGYRFFNFLHVKIEFLFSPVGVMGQMVEDTLD